MAEIANEQQFGVEPQPIHSSTNGWFSLSGDMYGSQKSRLVRAIRLGAGLADIPVRLDGMPTDLEEAVTFPLGVDNEAAMQLPGALSEWQGLNFIGARPFRMQTNKAVGRTIIPTITTGWDLPAVETRHPELIDTSLAALLGAERVSPATHDLAKTARKSLERFTARLETPQQ